MCARFLRTRAAAVTMAAAAFSFSSASGSLLSKRAISVSATNLMPRSVRARISRVSALLSRQESSSFFVLCCSMLYSRSWRSVHPAELVLKCHAGYHPSVYGYNGQPSASASSAAGSSASAGALSAGAIVFYCPAHAQLLPLLRAALAKAAHEDEIRESTRLAGLRARTFHPSDVPGTLHG